MEASDFYSILGVDREADSATIRQAFKRLALLHHPDKVPESERPDAEIKFKVISEAYEVLGNEESRMLYDAESQFGSQYNTQDWQEFYAGPQDYAFGFDFNYDFGAPPFSGAQNSSSSYSRRTENVIYETEMSLEEVYHGKVIKLSTQRQVVCRKCSGNGGRPRAQKRTCSSCGGRGSTRRTQMVGQNIWSTETVPCPVCKGHGQVFRNKDLCKRCEGTCTHQLKSLIEVYVPKGVKNNHRIVVEGQADEELGKFTGDLVIVVRVQSDHPLFRREGLDLYATAQISLTESLGGFSKPLITHLDGRELQVTVPKGEVTGPGSILRIPGEGLIFEKSDGQENTGDLYIQMNIDFPKVLPEDTIDRLVNLIETSNSDNKSPSDENNNDSSSTVRVSVNHEVLCENDLPEYLADANDEPEISNESGAGNQGTPNAHKPRASTQTGCSIM